MEKKFLQSIGFAAIAVGLMTTSVSADKYDECATASLKVCEEFWNSGDQVQLKLCLEDQGKQLQSSMISCLNKSPKRR